MSDQLAANDAEDAATIAGLRNELKRVERELDMAQLKLQLAEAKIAHSQQEEAEAEERGQQISAQMEERSKEVSDVQSPDNCKEKDFQIQQQGQSEKIAELEKLLAQERSRSAALSGALEMSHAWGSVDARAEEELDQLRHYIDKLHKERDKRRLSNNHTKTEDTDNVPDGTDPAKQAEGATQPPNQHPDLPMPGAELPKPNDPNEVESTKVPSLEGDPQESNELQELKKLLASTREALAAEKNRSRCLTEVFNCSQSWGAVDTELQDELQELSVHSMELAKDNARLRRENESLKKQEVAELPMPCGAAPGSIERLPLPDGSHRSHVAVQTDPDVERRVRTSSASRRSTVRFRAESEVHSWVDEDSDENEEGALEVAEDNYKKVALDFKKSQEERWEEMWRPEHMREVVNSLFSKHDKTNSGRLGWKTGEVKTFLEEFWEMHNFPRPKIPTVVFSNFYKETKLESGRGQGDMEGLDPEEMVTFALKAHDFIYVNLGKEMRELRRSFAAGDNDRPGVHRKSLAAGVHAVKVARRMPTFG